MTTVRACGRVSPSSASCSHRGMPQPFFANYLSNLWPSVPRSPHAIGSPFSHLGPDINHLVPRLNLYYERENPNTQSLSLTQRESLNLWLNQWISSNRILQSSRVLVFSWIVLIVTPCCNASSSHEKFASIIAEQLCNLNAIYEY